MMWWQKALVFLVTCLLSCRISAQCANAMQPSCGVYDACFAKYCPCQGEPSEYFLAYGKRYCTSFLANTSFSDAGKKWRDATLVCLQEKIVPHLDISEHPSCDCKKMRTIAFDSHVACYTQPQASICNLPIGDLQEIMKTIDKRDLFSTEGWKQMRAVAEICAGKAPDQARRDVWKKAVSRLPA